MPTSTYQVGASSDDCFRRKWPGFDVWDLAYAQMVVGWASPDAKFGGGMRFANITIPPGSTISTAHLTFRAAVTGSASGVNSRISAELVDDAPTFADDGAAFDARWANRTIARVDWDNISAWVDDTSYDSPEIKTVIQEIIDRPGWASGNDIVIFWEDFEDRSTHDVNILRYADSYDGSASNAPKLVVTFNVIYPTEPLLRVSGIVRTFFAGVGGQPVSRTELTLGGMSSVYVSPIGAREVQGIISQEPLTTGAGLTQKDYEAWLTRSDLDHILRMFGHFPTYREWVNWTLAWRKLGQIGAI